MAWRAVAWPARDDTETGRGRQRRDRRRRVGRRRKAKRGLLLGARARGECLIERPPSSDIYIYSPMMNERRQISASPRRSIGAHERTVVVTCSPRGRGGLTGRSKPYSTQVDRPWAHGVSWLLQLQRVRRRCNRHRVPPERPK